MQFETFTALPANQVRALIDAHHPAPMGVGIPFNGTRRWYLATFQKSEADIYTSDYLIQVTRRMLEVMGWMIADGIHTIYTPLVGRDLLERGEEYMQFSANSMTTLALDEFRRWYLQNHIRAACYGEMHFLPNTVQQTLHQLQQETSQNAEAHICYGLFADQPIPNLIRHVVDLYNNLHMPPTPEQLIQTYYGAMVAPLDLWIGSEQPTIFDVPLVQHGNTALYFLQFPTHYLTHRSWRRVLYDYLFIRGDQETFYPENITTDQKITGLGERSSTFWKPATR